MSISRKRPRTSELSELEAPKEAVTSQSTTAAPTKSKSSRRRYRKRSTKSKSKAKDSGIIPPRNWTVVNTYGGRFKPTSVFSKDEKYLFVATTKMIKVMAVSSGQCIRSFGFAGPKWKVMDFIVDPLNEFRIIVAYGDSSIKIFDWTDGLLITECTLPEVANQLAIFDDTSLLILTDTNLLFCKLPLPLLSQETSQPSIHEILKLEADGRNKTHISVDPTTPSVVVSRGKVLYVGTPSTSDMQAPELQFGWKEMTVQNVVASVACHGGTVALGEESGDIRLYFDVMESLKNGRMPTESLMRWHQSPITALQLSVNGIYLISGAAEETLVITQVNSGNKQFLPRLGAEIIGLRQSKSGSLYAASLSNNSIKIISAADLELRSEISGIHISSNPVPKREQRTSFHRSSVALLHPHRPQIYVNGAAINTSSGTLQSYDLGVDQQSLRLDVARVTRTKWTGKQKRPVFEPALTFAALTGDGTWLATIDEWENQYGFGDMDSIEIYLKFWAWKGKQWELVAKIDSPHGSDRRVLGLANPSQLSSVQEFATLGADGSVKVWRPSVQAHGQSSETVWSLHRTYGSHKLVPASEGSLKYSPDNSVLVAGLESDIHVIDAQNGHVAKSFHAGKSISEVGIVGRHLLCLHDNSSLFSCWDIATGQILFTERIDQPYATIAVNHGTSTFALSTSTTIKSTITISKIKSNKKIDEAEIRIGSVVTNLLGSDLSELSGFIFVDDAGQVGHVAAQAISNPSITNNTSEPVSSIIPVQVRQVEDGRESASSRPIGQTNRILDQDIKSALENEELGIARMYETIVQSIG